ncbi:extracellular solute-binding protein [Abyssisolibacter fermentans]|uniref:extracellular solute-binding protein n=1 Tax=Abyssisolibacter fermentans TaxID=1766203 RepID=UPI000831EF68|nr:extracellular solute-binding protein [Abyssisolibacter fermentans]
MKKITVLILCIILVLLTIACSNDYNDIATNNEQKEITILIKDYDLSGLLRRYCTIYGYTERFEIETGIKVNFEVINGKNEIDYERKMNEKLYLEEGPTLIYISDCNTYRKYIDQGVALNTEGKIPNLENVYNSLLDDGEFYFVPVGMIHWPIQLNRSAFDKMGIEDPKFDWTKEEYLKIREKWLKFEPEYFNQHEYSNYFEFMVDDLGIINESLKQVSLNNSRVIQYINDVREDIFSGKYILDKEYTYKNFYNMIFVNGSYESNEALKLHMRYKYENLRNNDFRINALKSLPISKFINVRNDIILPNTLYGDSELLRTFGFVVNKNGKNTELGMEFLNGLLSDKIQLEMFISRKDNLYPVNKEIESEIDEIEIEINEKVAKEKKEGIKHYVRKDVNEKATALRKYILQQVKTGNYKRCMKSKRITEIKDMMYIDLAKFIFADEIYTDKELSRELQKIKYKYNMYLNE